MCSLPGRDKEHLPGKGWNVEFQKASIFLSFAFLCIPGKTTTNVQHFQKIRITIAKSSTASPISKSLLKNYVAVAHLYSLECEESSYIVVIGLLDC